jgi:GTP-binding protein HflX
MNALTGADLKAEDKLFVTLDAVSRRFELSRGLPVILVDTVGFIRKLPHALVNAFHSTLEEAALADLLIHVTDASDPDMESCRQTTLQVLQSLGAGDIPMITVLNKIDRLPADQRQDLREAKDSVESSAAGSVENVAKNAVENAVKNAGPPGFGGVIPLSVRRGWGLETLRERMRESLSGSRLRFRFSPDRGDLLGLLHRRAQVISESWEDNGIQAEAWVDGKLAGQLRQYLI